MFRGRILIVSDHAGLVAELDPLIRAEGHLSLAVPSPDEAIQVLEDGIIPDIVISDLTSTNGDGPAYLSHFRRLNQLGQHLTIVTSGPGGAAHGPTAADVEPFAALPYPFQAEQVRASIVDTMERIRRDLESLRGEMFRETARLQKAIREAQMELVTALMKIMETKDPFMQGHCNRVADLARRVAEEMGVKEEGVELLVNAARLHEIGKVGISLSLLHKTSALTPEELAEIRDQARMGGQIVGAVPSLRAIAPLIETQYLDYTELGTTICPDSPQFLLASILRVVDVFDSMTSDRSYRRVLTREHWESSLKGESGHRYHPAVIDAFFRVIPEA
jgi:response regulator RpfG family c-di-GMP phosphodiesterase